MPLLVSEGSNLCAGEAKHVDVGLIQAVACLSIEPGYEAADNGWSVDAFGLLLNTDD